ncbi:MAG: hypothetical protein H0V89_04695 [Deltaproteobacteria bacterium]|nr:hypothetical protein [Deltaproteobacteria bacterium]
MKRSPIRISLLPLALAVGLPSLSGCNSYDLFRVGGFEQATFSNKADILFVVDNSESMTDEATALADNFSGFIADLQSTEDSRTYDGLSDAVTNYQSYVENRGAFVDFQFGITTTDVGAENGELVGDVPLVVKGSPTLAQDFQENLLCEATCFNDESNVSTADAQIFDDLCGTGQWRGNCGSAGEQPLEATYKAVCRAVPNPPTDCFAEDPEDAEFNPLTQAEVLSNEGLLREGSTLIPVIVSDEGDDSARLPTQERVPLLYEALFATFQHRMAWVAIAPTLTANGELVCSGPAQEWGVIRYKYLVEQTNGLMISIDDATPAATDIGTGCGPADFQDALDQLGALLQNLFNAFPLGSVPDEDTILVFVDGEEVMESEDVFVDEFQIERFSDGWTYRPEDNSVVFHGTALPAFDSNVQVFYQPVDGMPRELPF